MMLQFHELIQMVLETFANVLKILLRWWVVFQLNALKENQTKFE
jgi:hypothetical protein